MHDHTQGEWDCAAYRRAEMARDGCYGGGGSDYEDETETEEQEATSSKIVTARKARNKGWANEIKAGDRVRVTSGFTYKEDGPRTGYFRSYCRVAKGPAWATN